MMTGLYPFDGTVVATAEDQPSPAPCPGIKNVQVSHPSTDLQATSDNTPAWFFLGAFL